MHMLNEQRRQEYEAALVALLVRFGAREAGLREAVVRTLTESVVALTESARDGASLSALDVLRIRAGKFAAARLPASLYHDRGRLFALRREIQRLVEALLGSDARGRFSGS
jgi:hypothetical protein